LGWKRIRVLFFEDGRENSKNSMFFEVIKRSLWMENKEE
jgi:hypothetical protein